MYRRSGKSVRVAVRELRRRTEREASRVLVGRINKREKGAEEGEKKKKRAYRGQCVHNDVHDSRAPILYQSSLFLVVFLPFTVLKDSHNHNKEEPARHDRYDHKPHHTPVALQHILFFPFSLPIDAVPAAYVSQPLGFISDLLEQRPSKMAQRPSPPSQRVAPPQQRQMQTFYFFFSQFDGLLTVLRRSSDRADPAHRQNAVRHRRSSGITQHNTQPNKNCAKTKEEKEREKKRHHHQQLLVVYRLLLCFFFFPQARTRKVKKKWFLVAYDNRASVCAAPTQL